MPHQIKTVATHRTKYIHPFFMSAGGMVFRQRVIVYMRDKDGHWNFVPGKTIVLPDNDEEAIFLEGTYQREFPETKPEPEVMNGETTGKIQQV